MVIYSGFVLSGQPFFSHLLGIITECVCNLFVIVFPCNVPKLHTEQSCFFRIFPSGVQRLRLIWYNPLDDSLYVLRLCLGGFVSIFPCPTMDLGFSLTSVVLFIFVTPNTRIYVEPGSVYCVIFPCNLQRLITNPLCFSALPLSL